MLPTHSYVSRPQQRRVADDWVFCIEKDKATPALTRGKMRSFLLRKEKRGGHRQQPFICVTFVLCAAKNSLSSDTSVRLAFFSPTAATLPHVHSNENMLEIDLMFLHKGCYFHTSL